jgi:hypothetical protein
MSVRSSNFILLRSVLQKLLFFNIIVGSLRERANWGDQDIDGRIILRWIFRKLEGVVGTGRSWLRIGTGGGHFWAR